MLKSSQTYQVKNRTMDHPKRSVDKSEMLHIDLTNKGSESSPFSINRSHSGGYEPFVPSPGSSIGASVSMFSSRNSEAEGGDHDELDGSRTVLMHTGVADMLNNKEIQQRYPGFHQFLLNEQPTWFEPAPCNGRTYTVPQKTTAPENHLKLRKDINYEMLDLMYRYFREKHINAMRKRENKELLENNKKIQIAAVQMFAKTEQEEEYISNSFFKKIQQLKQEKDNLVKKYQKDEESLTNSLMANVAKIPDVHAEDTEKLMADKQAEIERLRAFCSRTEKNYQEELMRLRSEKVDHEAALEQEQELLINTLGKRMSQMNEEKRKLQKTLEQAYLHGFVPYDETVETALHATAKNGTSNSASSPFTKSADPQPSFLARQQFNESDFMHIENKRLAGMYNMERRRCDASINAINKRESLSSQDTVETLISTVNSRLSKMEAMIDAIRPECFSLDGSLEGRLSNMGFEDMFNTPTGSSKRQGSSPLTNVVRAQPSSSSNSRSAATPEQAAHSAPILATVFPTQRTTPARNERQ